MLFQYYDSLIALSEVLNINLVILYVVNLSFEALISHKSEQVRIVNANQV